MSQNSRIWIIVGSLFRKIISALLTFLFPSFYGRDSKYQPERYYMRGPGPKWRAKHLSKNRSSGAC
jgi:hypothetical protein